MEILEACDIHQNHQVELQDHPVSQEEQPHPYTLLIPVQASPYFHQQLALLLFESLEYFL
ncbi:MAG: hypothetical protein ACD_50C00277G0002 [uncultured bacterium]|nr:MAG: hypothetical protein ACD_50C00277G0002 [uncultured bacterium]